jgi:cytochrome c5
VCEPVIWLGTKGYGNPIIGRLFGVLKRGNLACVRSNGHPVGKACGEGMKSMFDRRLRSLLAALLILPATALLVELDVETSAHASPVLAAERQEARAGSSGAVDAGSAPRETVIRVCSGCHSTDLVFGERRSEAAWNRTVQDMRSLGALMTDAEMAGIVAYLAENFGTDTASAAAGTTSVGTSATTGETSGIGASTPPGGAFVVETCRGCHTMERVFDARKSEDGWIKTIQYMRTLGATVSDADLVEVVSYLGANFGLSSLSPDARVETAPPTGNDYVGFVCGGCHTMERVFDANKSEEGWTKTIQYMRTLGATVSDSELVELVQYLTDNFGLQ